MFERTVHYVLELGPTVMLPIVIALLSKILGMKAVNSFKAGIHVGIGFVGIGLVIDLMLNSIGPAAKAMTDAFHVRVDVVDIGWPGASPMTWASKTALVSIPVAIAVNVIMLMFRMTRVVNVDIWNIWHMTFTGAMVDAATGSYWGGICGVAIHAALAYKLGDWFAKDTRDYFGLDGIAIPHGTSAYLGPIAVMVEIIIERIPVINRINFSVKDIQGRFGALGEPVSVGFIMGAIIGWLAGYDFKNIAQLAVKTAAVMLLMPRVIKPIMEGLVPIARQARKRLQTVFGGDDFLIGLDPALLLGNTNVVSASYLFIPLSIVLAALIPGNRVLPFGDLATVGFFVAMAVAVHGGNLFRILVSGTVIMSLTLWIATQTIEFHTILARNAGALARGMAEIASMDQGGSPITYILIEAATLKNVWGLIGVALFYGVALYMTYRRAKGMTRADKVIPAKPGC